MTSLSLPDLVRREAQPLDGLDLYSLRSSMHAVIHYLEQLDPALAQRARERYECFNDLAKDPQRYGYATRYGHADDCEEQVVQQLQAQR